MRSGTPADAAELLQQVLEDEKALQGEGAVSVAHAQYYLGSALVFSGQLRAGLHHYSAGTEALVRLTPDDHRNHWARRRNLASAYLAARLPAEALRYWKRPSAPPQLRESKRRDNHRCRACCVVLR